jgi:antitoxin component YwqK of YwqJK toxin-antitoxin module
VRQITINDPLHISTEILSGDSTFNLRNYGNGPSGLWEVFYDSLKKTKACEYYVSDGRLFGKHRHWYRNGQLKREINYHLGIQHGLHNEFNILGKKTFEGNYQHGNREGYFRAWYGNGQIRHERLYRFDLEDSIHTEWHINGQKSRSAIYNLGELTGKESGWYETGQINFEKNYQNGLYHGIHNKYREDGFLEFEGTYKEGKLEGYFILYHEDGKIFSRLLYKENHPVTDEKFYTNGNKLRLVTFRPNSSKPATLQVWDSKGNEIGLSQMPEFPMDWDFSDIKNREDLKMMEGKQE